MMGSIEQLQAKREALLTMETDDQAIANGITDMVQAIDAELDKRCFSPIWPCVGYGTGLANPRRIKLLRVETWTIGIICGMNTMIKVESKLPPMARMVSAGHDQKTDCLWLLYECDEFDLVKEGDVVPELPWDTVTFIDEGSD